MNVDKKGLKEQEIRSLLISLALNARLECLEEYAGRITSFITIATPLQWLKQRRCPAICWTSA